MNLIERVVKETGLKQKDLAKSLGVTSAQISRWKSGESIPSNRKDELLILANLTASLIDWTGITSSDRDALDWINYFNLLNTNYNDYRYSNLIGIPEKTVPFALQEFKKAGITIPDKAPNYIDHVANIEDLEDLEELSMELTSFDLIVLEFLENAGMIEEWCHKYFTLEDSTIQEIGELLDKVEYVAIFHLELSKDNEGIFCKALFKNYRSNTKQIIMDAIYYYCNALNHAGLPIKYDYYDAINLHPLDLADYSLRFINKEIALNLSYAEREMLNSSLRQEKMLSELHQKIDSLLSLQ